MVGSNTKSKNRTQIIATLIGLLGVIIGTFGTIIYERYIDPPTFENSLSDNMALVEELDGVNLFIKSRPQKNDYISLGTIQTSTLLKAVESAEGKKGVLDVLKSTGKSLVGDIDINHRLVDIVREAKKQKEGSEGLIFSKNLNSCEAIRFK